MPDMIKISQLPLTTTISGGEIIPIVQGGVTKAVPVAIDAMGSAIPVLTTSGFLAKAQLKALDILDRIKEVGGLDADLLGGMSPASRATASTVMVRDSAGRAKVAAPSAVDDIAIKSTVDAVQANLTTHIGVTASGIHGSAVAGIANTLVHRDASGRAAFAGPAEADDAATKGYVDTLVGSGLPTGAVTMYGGATAPTGWLLCQGQAVSRTTYASLFAAISTAFGSGDGSTTFNVPDMREAAPVGAGTKSTGIFSGGAVTLTIASPCVGTLTDHKMTTGDAIVFSTTGALPTGLAINTVYYVIVINANTFNLATTLANALAGTKINTSGTQSGTHTLSVKHDVFTMGQFKDDQFQGHTHQITNASQGGGQSAPMSAASGTIISNVGNPYTDGSNGTPRTGTVTRGKRLGINFIIKT